MDFLSRSSFTGTVAEAPRIYLIKVRKPDQIHPLGTGKYHLAGSREIVVAEGKDRLLIVPEDDCVLDVSGGHFHITPVNTSKFTATWGVLSQAQACLPENPGTEDLFNCLSSLCQVPGEPTAFRSYPFFRRLSGLAVIPDSTFASMKKDLTSPIIFNLPPDLRYLFAAAPLASYLGAGIVMGMRPELSLAGEIRALPEDALSFERWVCSTLRLIFHADCAARYEATTGKRLAGIDIARDIGISPDTLLYMGIEERLGVYLRQQRSGSLLLMPWHTASYVDPVPANILHIPALLRSLSAIFAPAGRKVTEREVVHMEVRQFLRTSYRSGADDLPAGDGVIYPALQYAFVHQWLSDGYPIDAVKLWNKPVQGLARKHVAGALPRLALICNEDSMICEAKVVCETLEGLASIELLRNISPAELISIFSRGYDLVQFIGHCDHRGFKCSGGFADLSAVKENNTPVFFFNSCSSYLQGLGLLKNGSTCGISTLYNVIDEAALDVSVNFYRLLARGYPVLMAYLGAKDCSVLGKEYLLIGDGLITLFQGDSYQPLYRLYRSRHGYSLSCMTAGHDKGFIHEAAADGCAGLPDFGIVQNDIPVSSLLMGDQFPPGSCIYDGNLFNSIRDAVRSAEATID